MKMKNLFYRNFKFSTYGVYSIFSILGVVKTILENKNN